MGSGKAHKQATPQQIAELRQRLDDLEPKNVMVERYRWYTTDRVLHRFITARNGNVDVALQFLLDHLDWRASYGMDTILEEDMSGLGLGNEFYWSGFDRAGRPCLVFRACQHRRSEATKDTTPEQKVRYYCQLLERGFRDFSPAHKFCLILDCRGAGRENMDRKLMKVATPIIENNFPESQFATYVVPCGPLIVMTWKVGRQAYFSAEHLTRSLDPLGHDEEKRIETRSEVISSFIDPGTAEKIRLLPNFEDPMLLDSFTPETLEAFVTMDPTKASRQPYVAPDPLGNNPSPAEHRHRSFTSEDMYVSSPGPSVTARDGSPANTHGAATNIIVAATTTINSTRIAKSPVSHHDSNNVPLSAASVTVSPAPPSAATATARSGRGALAPPSTAGYLTPPSPYGSNEFDAPSPADTDYIDVEDGSSTIAYGGGGGGSGGGDGGNDSVDEPFKTASSNGTVGALGGVVGGEVVAASSGNGPARLSIRRRQQRGGEEEGNGATVANRVGGIAVGSGAVMSGGDAGRVVNHVGGGTEAVGTVGTDIGGMLGEPAANILPGRGGGETRAPLRAERGTPGKRPRAGAAAAAAVKGGGEGGPGGPSDGGGVGEEAVGGYEYPSISLGQLKATERTGYLYKRRDTLRGRFAYRRRSVVLRFPPASANVDVAAFGGRKATPPAPTLSLLKGVGLGECEKIISLEGAEVTLGKTKSGDLYPFVITFPNLPAQQTQEIQTRSRSQSFSRQPSPRPPSITPPPRHHHRAPSSSFPNGVSRRNTEDFTFPGTSIDPIDAETAAMSSTKNKRHHHERHSTGVTTTTSTTTTTMTMSTKASHANGNKDVRDQGLDPSASAKSLGGGGGGAVGGVGEGGNHYHLSDDDGDNGSRDDDFPSVGSGGGVARRFGRAGLLSRISSVGSSLGGGSRHNSISKTRHSTGGIRSGEGGGGEALGQEARGDSASFSNLSNNVQPQHQRHSSFGARGMSPGASSFGTSSRQGSISTSSAGGGAGAGAGNGSGGASATGTAIISTTRRSLYLACASEQETMTWARWIADAAVWHQVTQEACEMDRQRERELKDFGVVAGMKGGGDAGSLPDSTRRSYRLKYAETLAALAVATDDLAGGVRGIGGEAAGSAPETRIRSVSILDTYRRGKAMGVIRTDDTISSSATDSDGRTTAATPASGGGSSSASGSAMGREPKGTPSAKATTAAWKGLGEVGGSLMSMRDSEITRLRRAYARSELSRGEMRRCLKVLVVQLREGEDRTGSLLAEREALEHDMAEKEARLEQKEAAMLEEAKLAQTEAQMTEELVASLRLENRALQAALERLRLDFREERGSHSGSKGGGILGIVTGGRSKRSGPISANKGVLSEQFLPPRPTSSSSQHGQLRNSSVHGDGQFLSLGSHHRKYSPTMAVTEPTSAISAAVTARVPNGSSGLGGPGGSDVLSAASTPTSLNPDDKSNKGSASRMLGPAGVVMTHWDAGEHCEMMGKRGVVPEDAGTSPWVLNIDEAWKSPVRPPQQILSSLLEALDSMVAATSTTTASGSVSDAIATLVSADSAAFRDWSRRTEELQGAPPPEMVDCQPGQKAFTEGCLKLLKAHTSIVLGKHAEELSTREQARMAYAIGGDIYTIERLSMHVETLTAGGLTE